MKVAALTPDEGTTLNHALFGDTLGYVLKPPALRGKVVEHPRRYRIRLHILSAQRLPITPDLHVEARINTGEPGTPTTKRTSTLKGKAFNPTWDETMAFEIDSTPSMLALTFVQIEIKNKALLAQWARSVHAAPRGYHHLPLYDPLFSRYVFATLFVRIDVDELREL